MSVTQVCSTQLFPLLDPDGEEIDKDDLSAGKPPSPQKNSPCPSLHSFAEKVTRELLKWIATSASTETASTEKADGTLRQRFQLSNIRANEVIEVIEAISSDVLHWRRFLRIFDTYPLLLHKMDATELQSIIDRAKQRGLDHKKLEMVLHPPGQA